MPYRYKHHPRILNKETIQHVKATDVLYREMLFWRNEGKKLVQAIYSLVSTQDGKLAAKLANTFKDINDRTVEIATRLAPYQTPKLSSMELKSNKTIRYVIEAPKLSPNTSSWLKNIQEDQRLLPKPHQIINSNDTEDIEALEHE